MTIPTYSDISMDVITAAAERIARTTANAIDLAIDPDELAALCAAVGTEAQRIAETELLRICDTAYVLGLRHATPSTIAADANPRRIAEVDQSGNLLGWRESPPPQPRDLWEQCRDYFGKGIPLDKPGAIPPPKTAQVFYRTLWRPVEIDHLGIATFHVPELDTTLPAPEQEDAPPPPPANPMHGGGVCDFPGCYDEPLLYPDLCAEHTGAPPSGYLVDSITVTWAGQRWSATVDNRGIAKFYIPNYDGGGGPPPPAPDPTSETYRVVLPDIPPTHDCTVEPDYHAHRSSVRNDTIYWHRHTDGHYPTPAPAPAPAPVPTDMPSAIDAAANRIADAVLPVQFAESTAVLDAVRNAVRATAASELNHTRWQGWQVGNKAGYAMGIRHSSGNDPHTEAVNTGHARATYTPAPDSVHDRFPAHPGAAFKVAADAYHKGIDDGYDAARNAPQPDTLSHIAQKLDIIAESTDVQQLIANRLAAAMERQALAMEAFVSSGIRTAINPPPGEKIPMSTPAPARDNIGDDLAGPAIGSTNLCRIPGCPDQTPPYVGTRRVYCTRHLLIYRALRTLRNEGYCCPDCGAAMPDVELVSDLADALAGISQRDR